MCVCVCLRELGVCYQTRTPKHSGISAHYVCTPINSDPSLSPQPVVFSSDTLIDFQAHNRSSDLVDPLSNSV